MGDDNLDLVHAAIIDGKVVIVAGDFSSQRPGPLVIMREKP